MSHKANKFHLCKRNVEMKKGKGYKKLLSQLLTYVKPHKSSFILSVVYDLLAIGLNMTIPIFSGLAIDALIEY